jgi:hypothetical protein
MGGQTATYFQEDLRSLVRTYSVSKRPAPLVPGHPVDDQPVLGLVLNLSTNCDDSVLYAEAEVSPVLVDMVRSGRLRNISVKLFQPDHKDNPTPGARYLAHVGFLANQPPAVKNLGALNFCEFGTEKNLEFSEPMILPDLARAFEAMADGHLLGFHAPAGSQVSGDRLALHRRVLLRQCETRGMTYDQALSSVLLKKPTLSTGQS